MKSFKQFREECGCDKKEKKVKSKKKNGNVEVMPSIPDGQKGMTTKPTNESVFAGNYQGPLYARHPDLVKEVAPPGKKYERMVKHIKKNYPKDKEGIAYATAWKHKNKNESFESGVQKARRDYRSGTLLTFKQFMSKLTDILDEWEK
jgi:predicted patatin/cPLA2 family phospholipase|tara:strand:+ start:488 stop:928 length:441 start_codon:yes stop_codon:yes gene_type:complete